MYDFQICAGGYPLADSLRADLLPPCRPGDASDTAMTWRPGQWPAERARLKWFPITLAQFR